VLSFWLFGSEDPIGHITECFFSLEGLEVVWVESGVEVIVIFILVDLDGWWLFPFIFGDVTFFFIEFELLLVV
jgi:hypothetical protein